MCDITRAPVLARSQCYIDLDLDGLLDELPLGTLRKLSDEDIKRVLEQMLEFVPQVVLY